MKKIWTLAIGVAFVLAAMVFPQPASAKLDKEIRKYEKQVAKKQKEEAKAEAEKRRADPNRRLRPYHTMDEIYAEMDQIAKDHPQLVRIEEYGKSVQGRPLRAMQISSGPGDKAEILFSGNIHAQELAGAEFCMALIRKLVDGYGKDCQATSLLDNANVWVIPSLNPDGNFKASREQAKEGETGFVRKNKDDVDLNRNFPFPKDAPARLNFSAGWIRNGWTLTGAGSR